MIKAVLFDLDATLLLMDQDTFLKTYIGALSKKMSAHGYDPADFADALWKGSYAMIKNDGKRKNCDVFWEYYVSRFGERAISDQVYFEEFYNKEFKDVKGICDFSPASRRVVERIREKGFKTALATSPVFPAVATNERIRWAGLEPEHFELVTTYENMSYSKPNPKYYIAVAEMLGVAPDECLMVGNDVDDDMSAEAAGMQVFLITDYLVNRQNKDISVYQGGSFADFEKFVEEKL